MFLIRNEVSDDARSALRNASCPNIRREGPNPFEDRASGHPAKIPSLNGDKPNVAPKAGGMVMNEGKHHGSDHDQEQDKLK